MQLFVYLGLASAGGTVPVQALREPPELVSQIEPVRHILAGTRSILSLGFESAHVITRSHATQQVLTDLEAPFSATLARRLQ